MRYFTSTRNIAQRDYSPKLRPEGSSGNMWRRNVPGVAEQVLFEISFTVAQLVLYEEAV